MKKPIWKWIGGTVLVILLIVAWVFGFLWIVFYLLGLYAALYFVSILFKTTKIVDTILGVGIFVVYLFYAVAQLFLSYLSLRVMFTESFFWGLVAVAVGLPIAHFLLMAIIFVLASPLLWFQKDLEKRFDSDEGKEIYGAMWTWDHPWTHERNDTTPPQKYLWLHSSLRSVEEHIDYDEEIELLPQKISSQYEWDQQLKYCKDNKIEFGHLYLGRNKITQHEQITPLRLEDYKNFKDLSFSIHTKAKDNS